MAKRCLFSESVERVEGLDNKVLYTRARTGGSSPRSLHGLHTLHDRTHSPLGSTRTVTRSPHVAHPSIEGCITPVGVPVCGAPLPCTGVRSSDFGTPDRRITTRAT